MAERLDRMVELHNDSEAAFVGLWDGKEIEIEPGESVELKAGVAGHLVDAHPDFELRIEEILPGLKEARNPGDPLQQTDRGEAFAAVKGKQKPPAGE